MSQMQGTVREEIEGAYGRKITHSEVGTILDTAYKARLTGTAASPMFWGAPGIGKTEGGTKWAEAKQAENPNFKFYELHPVTFDNVDSGGVPYVRELKNGVFTLRAAPDFYSIEEGAILVDELPQSNPSVTSSLSKLFLPSNYGLTLSRKVLVFATGNREGDKAATFKLPSQINHRLSHYELQLVFENFLTYGVRIGMDPMILSFIKLHPELLQAFDPLAKASPNGRSWVRLDGKAKIFGIDNLTMLDIEACADLGPGCAQQLVSHVRLASELPDIQSCIDSPKTAPVPQKEAVQAILSVALAYRATPANLKNIFTYLNRLPTMELGALFVSVAGARNDKLRFTSAWVEWCATNEITN